MFADATAEAKVIGSLLMSNNGWIPSITPGTKLNIGKKHYTKDGSYYLMLQADGNLVVYNKNNVFAWGSHNNHKTPLNGKSAELLPSGNFVLEDAKDNVIWSTNHEDPFAALVIENNTLKVVNQNNQTLWPKPN